MRFVLSLTISLFLLGSEVNTQFTTEEKVVHLTIASSMIAHGADLSTSSWAFGKNPDKYKEANPILKPFADDPVKLAVAKMGSAVAINYLLLRLHKDHPKKVIIFGILQTIGIGYVAHRNAKLVR